MTNFDQKNQQVGTQYNAGGDITIYQPVVPVPLAPVQQQFHWEKYLNDLTKEIQARRGILGYVKLSGQIDAASVFPYVGGTWPKEFVDYLMPRLILLKEKLKRVGMPEK
jgi:hypothetical protein